jgi:hypothetical protein
MRVSGLPRGSCVRWGLTVADDVDRHRTSIPGANGTKAITGALYLNTPLMMIAAMKISAAIRSNPPMIFLFKVPLR